jgi:PAS domain S-box-containing protein
MRAYLSAALALCAGLLGTFVLFSLIRKGDNARLATRFADLADDRWLALQQRLIADMEVLRSVSRFYAASREVERHEFTTFTRDVFPLHPEILSLEWLPRVRAAERAAFEAEARREGFHDFQIVERSEDEKWIRAEGRDEYFPAFYLEPFETSKLAFGHDYASVPARRAAMERARDMNMAAATSTELFRLGDNGNDRLGFMVFLPIYHNDLPYETLEQRRENLVGFVTLVLHVNELVDVSLGGFAPAGVEFHLFDGASGTGQLLYTHRSRLPSLTRGRLARIFSTNPNRLTWTNAFNVADREWTIVCRATQRFIATHESKAAWAVLPAGVAVTALIIGYLLTIMRNWQRLEQMAGFLSDEVAERRKIQERLELQIERMPLACIVWDTEFRVQTWNPAAEKIFGFAKEEAIGQQMVPKIVSEKRMAEAEPLMKKLIEGGELVALTFENITQDGRAIVCEWTSTPLKLRDGTIVGVLSMARDITERKNMEKQLVHAQKMEAIGRLASGVAHDFNNLLTVIIGYSELMLKHINPDDPHYANIEEICKAGNRAAALTRQLLAFSRKQVLEPKVFDLNSCVDNMDKMLRRLIGEDIELIIKPAPNIGRVKADPGQIEQVIMNLVVNARDAMPSGGKITVETANVVLDQEYASTRADVTPGDYVMIAVSDTGTGMTEEVKAHIFEPFFTTKELGKGTGLGLSTSFGIVKQHGGHIAVYSELGEGTTFKVYLPQVKEAAETLAARPEGEIGLPRGTETILIVEDEPGLRKFTAIVLRELGYNVLDAANGEDALRLAEEYAGQKIDLMFTDIIMPRIGAKELAEKLRKMHPETKLLFTSGYTETSVVGRGVMERGIVFLQKPFTAESLARKIREVLDNK